VVCAGSLSSEEEEEEEELGSSGPKNPPSGTLLSNPKSKDLIADEFRLASKGQTPSQSFVDDTYKSLQRSGQLGSPSSIASGASQQIASLFPEYRTKSAEEYAMMSRYGPGKIDPESGALLFRMPDTIKAARMKSAEIAKAKGLV